MSLSECCGCAMAFYVACQQHMMVQYCCGSGSTNMLFCMCFDKKPMKLFYMCGYTR